MIRIAALSAAILLTACAPRQVYAPVQRTAEQDGRDAARAAGQSRGWDLNIAEACGARHDEVLKFIASAPNPVFTKPEYALIYRTILLESYNKRRPQPASEVCDRLRRQPEFAALFPPPPPPTRAERAAQAAEQRAIQASSRGPAYCGEGSLALLIGAGPDAGVQTVQEKCRIGDTVVIPGAASGIIATVCDMAKPVVSSGGSVTCSIGPVRQLRRSP